MDWLDLLAVQGTLKSLLQHHSSKAPILQHSAFFTVQLSHPYMSIGRTMTLTRRTFVGKMMSLCSLLFVVVQLPSHVRPFLTPWTAALRASTAPPQTRLSPWKAWKELGFILGCCPDPTLACLPSFWEESGSSPPWSAVHILVLWKSRGKRAAC